LTSASRKVSLMQSFRAALGGTGEVIAADITPWAAAMQLADRAAVVPRSDDEAFVPALLRLCAEHRIALLVPTRDEELPVFASHAEQFRAVGTAVHVADLEAVDTCQDKQRFHDFCRGHGFPVPEQVTDPTAASLPLFARPQRGKGGVGSMRVDRLEQLEGRRGQATILSRFIDAPEFTIDVFVSRDGRAVSSVPRERV
jgi:carbamoyl-phosphate synthase large subunit